MAFFGRVLLALFALVFAVALAAPRQHVFGFGKRASDAAAAELQEQFQAYKRPMGSKFNMGFGKRGGQRQFLMGFGKRSMDLENFESTYEY